jgi:hypothetical protein
MLARDRADGRSPSGRERSRRSPPTSPTQYPPVGRGADSERRLRTPADRVGAQYQRSALPNPLGFVPVDTSAPEPCLGHLSAASWRDDVCTSHGRVPRVGSPRLSKSASAPDRSSRRRLLSPSGSAHLFHFLPRLSNPTGRAGRSALAGRPGFGSRIAG